MLSQECRAGFIEPGFPSAWFYERSYHGLPTMSVSFVRVRASLRELE